MMRVLAASILYYLIVLLAWTSPLVALIWLGGAGLDWALNIFALAYLICWGLVIWKLRIPGAGIACSLWIWLQESLAETEQLDLNAPTIIFRMASAIGRIDLLYCYLNFTLEEDSKVTLILRDKLTGVQRTVLDEYELPAGERSLLYRNSEIAVSNYEYETTIVSSKTITLKGDAVSTVDMCDVAGPGHMLWKTLRSLDGQNFMSWDLLDFGEGEGKQTLTLDYCSGNAVVNTPVGEGFCLNEPNHLEFADKGTVFLVGATNRMVFTTTDGWTFITQKGYRSNLIRDEATGTLSYVSRNGHIYRYGKQHDDRCYLDQVTRADRVLRRYNYATSGSRCRLESIEWDTDKLLRFEYDEETRSLLRVYKEGELGVELSYDEKRRLTSCVSSDGATLNFAYQQLPIPGNFLSSVTNTKGKLSYFCRYRKGQFLVHTDNGPVTLNFGQAMAVKPEGEPVARAYFSNPLDLSRSSKSRIYNTSFIHLPGCGFVSEFKTRWQRPDLKEWDLELHQIVREAGNDGKVTEIIYDEFAEEVWRNESGKVTRTWYHPPEQFTPPCLTSCLSAQLDSKGNLSRYVYNQSGEYLYDVPLVKKRKWYKF